jgi:hypothetical protein
MALLVWSFSAKRVTVLTSIAQSVAEALAFAPEQVEQVLTQAALGAPWRGSLRIEEPSSELATAIEELSGIVRRTKPSGDVTVIDDVLLELSNRLDIESGLERLARRVLRSTLEQRLLRLVERNV